MVFLKEDGSLDIDRMLNLPIEEFIETIENMTMEQYNYFTTNLPPDEGNWPPKAVEYDPLEELIKRGEAVDLKEYLNNWEKEIKNESET